MYRIVLLAGLSAWVGLLAGCATTEQRSDCAEQMTLLERERDAYQDQLAAAEARYTALQKRMEAVERKWDADRATALSLRSENKRLNEAYEQLKSVYERFQEEQLTRPEIEVSPLPDEIDAALGEFANRLPGRVWYDRARGGISFANDRLFEMGSDTIRSDAFAALQELAEVLLNVPAADFDVIVVGHTDDVPIKKPETKAEHPTNWHLSVHRAIAVQQALIDAGVGASRFGVMGYAEYRPVSDDRAMNRRVEVFIVRKGAVQPFQPVRPS